MGEQEGQQAQQQYMRESIQPTHQQRTIATGNNKHRAISVTEAPKAFMEASNGSGNHFNSRHQSQSS